MAKKTVLENGLTAKLDVVLKAVQTAGKNGATADELFANEAVANASTSVQSVRSSLARLDKTLGLISSKKVLNGDKVGTRYFAKENK